MTCCESRAECISIGSYYWDFNDQYFRTLRTSIRAAFVWHNNCKTVYFLDPICVHVIRLVRSWFLGERHCTLLFLFKICLETWNGIILVYKYTYNDDNKNKKKMKSSVAQMIMTFSELCYKVYDLHASKKHLKVSYIISR